MSERSTQQRLEELQASGCRFPPVVLSDVGELEDYCIVYDHDTHGIFRRAIFDWMKP